MEPNVYVCLNCNEQIAYLPGTRIMCPCCGADYGLEGDTVNEFCPKCGEPLEVSEEPDRLCTPCGWWGDKAETLNRPPITGDLNTIVRQAMDLYRTVLRQELISEQILEQGKMTLPEMQTVRKAVRDAKSALMEIFFVIQKHNKKQFDGEVDSEEPE